MQTNDTTHLVDIDDYPEYIEVRQQPSCHPTVELSRHEPAAPSTPSRRLAAAREHRYSGAVSVMDANWSVVLFGALLAAIVSGSSGFAFGLIASAIWLHVLAPGQVVPLAVICSMLLNLMMVWKLRAQLR